MLKTLLAVYARDLTKVVSFIKKIEAHLDTLVAKEKAKLSSLHVEIAKLEDEARSTVSNIELALHIKGAATAAATPAATPVADAAATDNVAA